MKRRGSARRGAFARCACAALLAAALGAFAPAAYAETAEESNEIVLLADVSEDVTILAGDDVTIDLAGHTFKKSSLPADPAKAVITNYGTLTLKDSSTDSKGALAQKPEGDAAIKTALHCALGSKTTITSGRIEGKITFEAEDADGKKNSLTATGGIFRTNPFVGTKYENLFIAYTEPGYFIPCPHTSTSTTGYVPATCGESGATGTVACSSCKTVLRSSSVIPPTGNHDFGDWEVTTPATEEAEGVETRECSVCGQKETRTIEKLVHVHNFTGGWQYDEANHWHVCTCGETSDVAPHVFGEGTTSKEPTANQPGVMTYTCTVCPAQKHETIPATGEDEPKPHTHAFAGLGHDATSHWSVCGECGESYDIAQHTFGEWVTTAEPTAAEEGAQTRPCTVCGFAETKALPALEPDANGWIETDDGAWQFVDEDGELVEEGWQNVGDIWYYFEEETMQTGWENVDGTWYYLNKKGEGTEGAMATGWKLVDNDWYYFKKSGAMQVGWKKDGAAWYYLNSAGEGVEGSMATGWKKDGDTWYYLNKRGEGVEGAMATGWKFVDDDWYHFEKSGAMQFGWQRLGGTWYLLDTTHRGFFGSMLAGWQRVDHATGEPTTANTWFYLDPETGAMAESTWVGDYYVDEWGYWRAAR
ncbi:hypothetical protein GMI69_02300 [Eggerthellaceae bacterium zg-887]|uniref:N-acetylmuramoyl-L-alanine amidase family protein n=1 Tax=Xiamenia xianingshaonis TaxID=2682776 RepID=UPI00140B703C|nr:N-acetylmuramoyl-L-alanine amidase family protein [Xiamenia xianingshaonis]NHM15504.1 hypothetical protein [Xiamenia xianingshaonis]